MLYEQYRPKEWNEVVGQPKAIAQIQTLQKRGLAGHCFWISGNSGTGKTTIARLIAAEVADDFFVHEVDATDLTPAKLKSIEHESHLTSWGKGGRAFIVNEAHGLRKDTIRQLLVMLERVPSHVVWIFTTTRDGQEALFDDYDDAGPLLSRCIPLALTTQGLAQAFAKNVKRIAMEVGLDGRPIAEYVKLARKCGNNHRMMLQQIEAGVMAGGAA